MLTSNNNRSFGSILNWLLRWCLVLCLPLSIFALFVQLSGANPLITYQTMWRSAFGSPTAWSEVLIRMLPFVLTALATALPAKVRLINVGGEGQLVIGALCSTVVALQCPPEWPSLLLIPMVLLAGAAGGACWAAIAAGLRVRLQVNETIATLLLNYIAVLVVRYCVHGFLKDPASFNWPFSPPLPDAARLATWANTRLHWGIVFAPLLAGSAWYLVQHTAWGLHLKVVGGNPQAANRAGYPVASLQFWAFVLGGALAGLAGALEVAGVEGRLRPSTGIGFGYVGFLAAWMANQNLLGVLLSSFLLATIAVSGDSLQMIANLPASAVNVLMALMLLAVLAKISVPSWLTQRLLFQKPPKNVQLAISQPATANILEPE